MLLYGCRRLDAAPRHAVMVGDSRFDQQAAAAAGIPFAGFGGIDGAWTLKELTDLLAILGASLPPFTFMRFG
jgi:phosphoglycolate phosphatase-like HAD superfamily hydrolase